jgi:hypothetical protein
LDRSWPSVGRLFSLDAFLATGHARGWLNARGTQRTASPHVLAASRTRHRLGCVLAAMRDVLNQRSDVAPTRVRPQVPPAGHTRDGLRSNQARLPKDERRREALASQVGPDGDQRFAWGLTADLSLGLRDLPALAALRQIGRPPDSRGTVPGAKRAGGAPARRHHPPQRAALGPMTGQPAPAVTVTPPGSALQCSARRPAIRASPLC